MEILKWKFSGSPHEKIFLSLDINFYFDSYREFIFRELNSFFSFCREIEGVVYPGEVKEKAEAKKAFEKAKRKGQSAGHVAQK